MDFEKQLQSAVRKNNSLVCVGLDPDAARLEGSLDVFQFNKRIIDLTANLVCAFKPNSAFYEAYGTDGFKFLKLTVDYIKENYPEIPVILDAKRADIGSTSEMYARQVFDFLGVDAVTVNPYLGEDSLEPFLKRKDKGIIVLCRTSNPSASDFQDLQIDGLPLYVKVAEKVVAWNEKYKNLLMVVGATYPEELKTIREIAPKMTFLVPGVGSQGGDLEKTLKNGLLKDRSGLIISSSRGIIYSPDPKSAAQKLKDEINKSR
jgi:orotidine 5'-phosphate decarboxylase subfamily 2